MTRIDMPTSGLHRLLAPVIPHACTDKDEPTLGVVRIETRGRQVTAVASDRSTLAAERHTLGHGEWLDPGLLHAELAGAKAALGLFTFSKDEDPALRVTVDDVPVPITAAGNPATIRHRALKIASEAGTSIVLHDKRDPTRDPLAGWRKTIAAAVRRELALTAPALLLNAAHLGKWVKAVRKGERLAVFTGARADEPLLILVEDHFVGVWKPAAHLDSAADLLAASPWRGVADVALDGREPLGSRIADAARAAGMDVTERDGTTLIDVPAGGGWTEGGDDGE